MKDLLRNNKWFFLPLLLFLVLGLAVEFTMGSHAFTFRVNAQHTPYLDAFFRFATWLGDGVTIGLVILLLLFIRYRFALVLGLAILLNTVVTQWLKHSFDHDRPARVLSEHALPFVEGVKLYYHHGFPSGHTSAAFCLYATLAFFAIRKQTGLMYFFVALLVGFSRIYLLQHFLEDVLFGATIGTLSAMVVYSITPRIPPLSRSGWNRSLRDLFS
jgi:membrane-associated phospholipid phosphatase